MNELPESGPIKPLRFSRTFDHRGERRPCAWVVPADPPRSLDTVLELKGATSALEVPADEPLIAALPEPGHDLFRRLRKRSDEARTWLLAPPEMTELHLADVKRAAFGVRRMHRRPPAFVVTAEGTRGWVELLGCWWELDEEQARALRQEAVRLFWIEAEAEFAVHGQRRFERPAEAPFDVLGTSEEAPARILPTVDEASVPGDSRHIVHAMPPGPDTRLCFAQPGSFSDEHLKVVRRGGRVVASEALPPLALDERGGTVWLGRDGGWWLRLRLVPGQAARFSALLEALAKRPEAELRVDVLVGDLAGRRAWLPERPDFEKVIETLELDASSVQADSFAGMPRVEPSEWPEDGAPHLEHVVNWEVLPPVAPPGAGKDPLIRAWNDLDRRFAKRVKVVKKQVEGIEAKGNLAGRFADFASRWLGFKRTVGKIGEQLEGIKNVVPSRLGPDKAAGKLNELAKLEKDVAALRQNVDDAEHEARLQEARREQEAAHAKEVEAAKREAERLESEIERVEKELSQAAVALGEREKQPKPKNKKERKRHRRELESARRRHRELDQEVERLRSEKQRAEERIEAPFVFKPPDELRRAPAAESFVPEHHQVDERVPSEALPEVGRLLRSGEQRFLVIGRWEERQVGEREAERLGAKLVTE